MSCSSIPMDESQFFQKEEDLNHIGNLLISGPYQGRLIGYLCILSIIFSHRPHCKTESELYELEKEISYMMITLYTYHYSYLSSFNLILFLFWDFRSRNCRGITRIHRSPSRPRPSMRPTADVINIHEHPL